MSSPTPTGKAETQERPIPVREKTVHDYKGRIKPIWCPGCGNYSVLGALTRIFVDLGIEPENLAVVSGIGCSSRMPGFIKCYGYHGVHGRALPSAVGVKLGNPRLTVLAVGGDGDGLSIGMGHFPHTARRNIDLTYVLLDNRIYGLTKGQTSPTTCQGWWTKTSPEIEETTSIIGENLMKDFLLPFEVLSVLLLIALVGSVFIARREVVE